MAVSKDLAVKRLQMRSGSGFQHPDGAFLVRPSEANPDNLSLSVRFVIVEVCQLEMWADHLCVKPGNGWWLLSLKSGIEVGCKFPSHLGLLFVFFFFVSPICPFFLLFSLLSFLCALSPISLHVDCEK